MVAIAWPTTIFGALVIPQSLVHASGTGGSGSGGPRLVDDLQILWFPPLGLSQLPAPTMDQTKALQGADASGRHLASLLSSTLSFIHGLATTAVQASIAMPPRARACGSCLAQLLICPVYNTCGGRGGSVFPRML